MMFEVNKKRDTLMKIKNLIAIFSVIVSFYAGAYTSWENSPNNWKNSSMNFDNSPMNWKNNPMNFDNSPMNYNAKNGFYDSSGDRIGYCVGQNCFKDRSGERIGYGNRR